MKSKELVIKNGTVLVGLPLEARFEQWDLRAADGVITELGPDLQPSQPDAEIVEAHGSCVLPGFVDAHQHLWEASMRGLTSGGGFADFMFRVRVHYAAVHGPDDVYAGVLAGALTTLASGTTTVVDHMHAVNSPAHAAAGLDALRGSGLRARWAYGTSGADVEEPHFASEVQRWDLARSIRSDSFSAQSDSDRVTMGLAIADIGTYGWDVAAKEYELAGELDLALTSHANCFWGAAHPPEFEGLHRHGLLGPRQLYSHANNTTPNELRLLADHGSAVVTTPETELQLGLGFPLFHHARAAGVAAGLGSDIQANNSPDMFAQMRLAMHAASASVHQLTLQSGGTAQLDRPAVDPVTIYHCATLGGAQAAGLEDIVGSLAVGKAADVVVLRMDELWHHPLIDPFATIVQQAGVRDVDAVIVGGEVVKRDGTLPSEQTQKARGLIQEASARLSSRMTDRGGARPAVPPGLLGQVADAVNENLG